MTMSSQLQLPPPLVVVGVVADSKGSWKLPDDKIYYHNTRTSSSSSSVRSTSTNSTCSSHSSTHSHQSSSSLSSSHSLSPTSNSSPTATTTTMHQKQPLALFVQSLLADCSSSLDQAEEDMAFQIVQDNCCMLSERARQLIHLSYSNHDSKTCKTVRAALDNSCRWDACESPLPQRQTRRKQPMPRPMGRKQRKRAQRLLKRQQQQQQTPPPAMPVKRTNSNETPTQPCRRASLDLWPLQQSETNATAVRISRDTIPCLPPRCGIERSKLKWSFALDDMEGLDTSSSSASSSAENNDNDNEDENSCDTETTYSEFDAGNSVDWSVASDSDWDSSSEEEESDSESDSDSDDYSESESESYGSDYDYLLPHAARKQQPPSMFPPKRDAPTATTTTLASSAASNKNCHAWVLPQNQILPNIQALIHQAAKDPSVDIHQCIQQALQVQYPCK